MKGKTADSISAEGNENYDQEEVERLTRFAQIPNQVDVTRRLSDLQSLVSQSINTNNLTQLEKQINSAYSLFLTVEEETLPPKSIIMTDNAPANKNMEKQLRFFSTKRKHNREKRVRLTKPTRDEKEQLMSDYRKKSKFELMSNRIITYALH